MLRKVTCWVLFSQDEDAHAPIKRRLIDELMAANDCRAVHRWIHYECIDRKSNFFPDDQEPQQMQGTNSTQRRIAGYIPMEASAQESDKLVAGGNPVEGERRFRNERNTKRSKLRVAVWCESKKRILNIWSKQVYNQTIYPGRFKRYK